MDIILNFASFTAGAIVSIYFGLEARKLSKRRISFNWEELHTGSRDLARQVRRSRFIPDLIISISVRGATVAGIVTLEFNSSVPLLMCIQEDKSAPFRFRPGDHVVVESDKWRIHLPEALLAHNDKKLLIVDDFTMSGGTLAAVRQELEMRGWGSKNIRTATLVCTAQANDLGKGPDFYWWLAESHIFYFPWGVAR
jgi:hypoxanthine phosphoribosyltransferase